MSSLRGGTSDFLGPPDHPLDRGTPKPNAARRGWILLACALAIYCLKWGVGTIRAFSCLKYGHPPKGHWYDNLSLSAWNTLIATAGSAMLLYFASRLVGDVEHFNLWERLKHVVQHDKEGQLFSIYSLPVLGLTWSIPLLITRCTLHFLFSESNCNAPSSKGLLTWRHLSGPAEELWFAAALAAIVILTRDKPKVRLLCAVLGGAFLRGVFHIYQGWESVGLFAWGALVAVTVAWTGRWMMFFILHFMNNFFISIFNLEAWEPPFLFSVVFAMWLVSPYVMRRLRNGHNVSSQQV